MLTINQWFLLKDHLYRGVPISVLARDLGFDRKTVRKVKRSNEPFTYKKRKPKQ